MNAASRTAGPLFNAQPCPECHQNPVSGGATQVLEPRIGHRGLYVPIVEAPGQTRVGRFGWKDQQASLVSFRAMPTRMKWALRTRFFPMK